MRTACWLSALLALSACTESPRHEAAPARANAPPAVTARTSQGRTTLTIHTTPGATSEVTVDRDETVGADSEPNSVRVVAAVSDRALVLVDTYDSKPLGLSMCQAGEESFLRVISIVPPPARETLHMKVTSCRENLELADPGLEWRADASTLYVKWLSGPNGPGIPDARRIAFDAKGDAHLSIERQSR